MSEVPIQGGWRGGLSKASGRVHIPLYLSLILVWCMSPRTVCLGWGECRGWLCDVSERSSFSFLCAPGLLEIKDTRRLMVLP